MPTPAFLDRLPRPVVYGLYGTVAGLLAALTVGELVWYLLRPAPLPEIEAHTVPPATISAKLAVAVSPKGQVYSGGTNTVAVRVARDRFEDPVTVRFSAAAGLTVAEVTIPAGETTGQAVVVASATAKPGVFKLTATAVTVDGQTYSASAPVEITVLPLPPPPPRLAVRLSSKVQAYQRGKNTFAVRVARGEFDGDVAVSFDGLPAGVTIPNVVIPAGQTEATAELTAEGSTKTGLHTITATARAPKVGAAPASAETTLEVLGSPKLPVDVVLVLDCTGSMKKAIAGIDTSLGKLGSELAKAQLDVRFALVGFQDRTLGQMLQVPQFGDQPMTADLTRLRTAISGLRLGGGGGEGESSLDGIARAADMPFRTSVPRIVLLITDGGPKKVDWRIKSMEEMVKSLKEKKIDQLHIAALPNHRKEFEPLWEGAKGRYLDLAMANASDDYDKLMTDLGKAVWESLPVRPESKPETSAAAAAPVLPVGPAKPPALLPGARPEEPKIEKPTAPTVAVAVEPPTPSNARRNFAAVAWASAVLFITCTAMLLGQLTFLPGEVPSIGAGAASYGVGLFAGLAAGATGFFTVDAITGGFLARLAGGCGLGLGIGLLVPLEQMLRQGNESLSREPVLDSPDKPMKLADGDKGKEPTAKPAPAPAPAPTAAKPAIVPPKPRDGCPGCGRVIPGEPGMRYCMLCDNTF